MTVATSNPAPSTTSGDNAAVPNAALPNLHRLFDAVNDGDPGVLADTIAAVVTGDVVDHGSPIPLPPGPAGCTQIHTFVTSDLQVRYETADLQLIARPGRVEPGAESARRRTSSTQPAVNQTAPVDALR